MYAACDEASEVGKGPARGGREAGHRAAGGARPAGDADRSQRHPGAHHRVGAAQPGRARLGGSPMSTGKMYGIVTGRLRRLLATVKENAAALPDISAEQSVLEQ